jgi:hypothetical protein
MPGKDAAVPKTRESRHLLPGGTSGSSECPGSTSLQPKALDWIDRQPMISPPGRLNRPRISIPGLLPPTDPPAYDAPQIYPFA